MKTIITCVAIAALGVGIATAGSTGSFADSGQIQDPTGCATGSAIANCRSLPPMGQTRHDSDLRNRNKRGSHSSGGLMHTSPLPSEQLLRQSPPPGSTGLDKGSTGLGGKGPRMGH